jgi:hypothetical protein
MSEPSIPRWQLIAAAPASAKHFANTGIRLSRSATTLVASPLLQTPCIPHVALEAPVPPIPLPMIPTEEVRRCTTFLRSLYRHNSCRGAMALYLNLHERVWQAALPQQLASPAAFRANLRDLAAAHLSPQD